MMHPKKGYDVMTGVWSYLSLENLMETAPEEFGTCMSGTTDSAGLP